MDKPTVDFYNIHAQEQAALYDTADMSGMYKRIVSFCADHGRILEIGCGSGRDARALVDIGFSVVATDASQGMIRQAKARSNADGDRLRFLCVPFPLTDGHFLLLESFDLVLAVAVFMHFSPNDRKHVVNQLAQMLRSKGIFYCTFKNQASIDERLYQTMNIGDLEKECQSDGLTKVFHQVDTDILGRNASWVTAIFEKE